jgi:phospholipase/carboxylesterase
MWLLLLELKRVFYSRQKNISQTLLCTILLIIAIGIFSVEVFGKDNEASKGHQSITFKELILSPSSGKKPDSLVVLFHGYGDVAENFIFLSAFWADALPNTLFAAIEGPMACKEMQGKKWLNTPSKNTSQLIKEINLLAIALNRHIDGLLKKYNLTPDKLALVGFSQGARVAMHIGLRRPCAGVVGFSGSYLNDTTTKVQASLPPILLISGLKDPKVSSAVARESHKCLEALKVPVTLFLMPGLGHTIDPQGSQIAGEFLNDCFSGKIKA